MYVGRVRAGPGLSYLRTIAYTDKVTGVRCNMYMYVATMHSKMEEEARR